MTSAHPRSRGENSSARPGLCIRCGSSPLTRGKLLRAAVEGCVERLIPAHAGKTAFSGPPRWGFSAHPRSRGENCVASDRGFRQSGSSPLTRGKRRANRVLEAWFRLIPAHAGKTAGGQGRDSGRPAHPRSRGENGRGGRQGIPSAGSSPLTRGKRRLGNDEHARERLIPAHAGKTRSRLRSAPSGPAHPRSRGENEATFGPKIESMGSSPLTRGKPPTPKSIHGDSRLIPAHAGKTRVAAGEIGYNRAHPRSRGENFDVTELLVRNSGSSPLTRGKL